MKHIHNAIVFIFESLFLATVVYLCALLIFNHRGMFFSLNEIIKPLWGG